MKSQAIAGARQGAEMIAIRRFKPRQFTILPTEIFEAKMSFRALGILLYLLSKPPKWRVSVAQLQKRGGIGRDAVHASLAEIESAGYLTRPRSRTDGGVFGEIVYELRDSLEDSDEPRTEKPDTVKPDTVNPRLSSIDRISSIEKDNKNVADAPAGLNAGAWLEWVEYRKKIKKPIKAVSMAKAMAAMVALGDQQRAAVDHSVFQGYQGLFLPKTPPRSNGRASAIEFSKVDYRAGVTHDGRF